MGRYIGKFEKRTAVTRHCPWLLVPAFPLLVELFGWQYLRTEGQDLWPIAFAFLWVVILGSFLQLLPWKLSRGVFASLAAIMLVYGVGQTGYYLLFSEMMWLSDFRYAQEGAGYLDVVLQYPAGWFLWVIGLSSAAVVLVWKYPRYQLRPGKGAIALVLMTAAVLCVLRLPQLVFLEDSEIRYSGSDYGRAQSAEAVYENMFHPHRLYQICGLHHMLAKDVYANLIYPLTPGAMNQRETMRSEVDSYFADRTSTGASNEMTGILKDKNVVLVLMESMDDWMIGNHTPTIRRLMREGISFTNFYTPPYGGIRTFNTEFCVNTGSFLSSRGGYAFDYVTNCYDHSLANQLKEEGYSPKLFHYNDPVFYSRGVYSEALGYDEYVCYGDYVEEKDPKKRKQILYDDLLLFTEPELRAEFFRKEGKLFNFVITRSAHLSYKYNEVLSNWALKKYPEYKGMTGSEEMDCALVKARLVDDFFGELLAALEEEGKLQDTVIIGITDHYTYGYKNTAELLELSGVKDPLLLEKTPCFIWSTDLEPMEMEKTLNTADFLPTLLNMLGIEPEHDYIGMDAFDEEYRGFVPFSNGSWVLPSAAYNASSDMMVIVPPNGMDAHEQEQLESRIRRFTRINNLILEADYYE